MAQRMNPPPPPLSRHFRRWGAAYILLLLFLGSWLGQLAAQLPEIREQGWRVFWAATLENWQSEYAQLLLQAVMLLGMKHWIFKADAEDLERIEAKLDKLLDCEHGDTPEAGRGSND